MVETFWDGCMLEEVGHSEQVLGGFMLYFSPTASWSPWGEQLSFDLAQTQKHGTKQPWTEIETELK